MIIWANNWCRMRSYIPLSVAATAEVHLCFWRPEKRFTPTCTSNTIGVIGCPPLRSIW
jgi:hypothetical protein